MKRLLSRLPWDLLLVLVIWLYIFPYSVGLNNPNERTRLLQARAIVDSGTLAIAQVFKDARGRWRARDLYGDEHGYDPRRGHVLVNDTALVCTDPAQEPPACEGLVYPAKAPGTALLGVPALALASKLGFIDSGAAGEPRATWAVRYGAVVPLMLLGLWAFGWLLRRRGESLALSRRAVVATGLGTTCFSYGIIFVGHALASAALMVGVASLVKARAGGRVHLWAALGGLATASAVLLEYHAAIAVLPVALWVAVDSARGRLMPGFAIASAAVLAVYGALHQLMFLSPLKTGHFYLMSAHNRASQSTGFLGIEGVTLDAFGVHLVDSYMGLASFMPWLVVLGGIGLPILLIGPSGQQREPRFPVGAGRVLAAIPLIYLVFVSSLGKFRMMNGWSIGPRYLLPAMLPLAYCAAVAWGYLERRQFWVGRALTGLVIVALVVVGAMTAAFPSPPNSVQSPFGEFALPLLREGWGVRHLGLMLGVGLWPLWLLLAGAACWIVAGAAPPGVAPRQRLIGSGLALVIAIVGVMALERRGATPTVELDKAKAWATTVVEGQSPREARQFLPPRP